LTLIERWTALLNADGGADADMEEAIGAAGLDLITRYNEPHRRYHSLQHLTEVLDLVDHLAAEADDLDAVRLAAWFHDAVYESGAAHAEAGVSNEEASARLAELVLPRLGEPAARVAEVARLVRLTEQHSAEDGDRNAAVLFDADLAILAAEPARYEEYTQAVREEYREIPDELFRPGRAQILEALLAAPALYRTPSAHARLEPRARTNATAEIARLLAPTETR
jgi:predicted metal-dependent HD superfamily phosphohydrolase